MRLGIGLGLLSPGGASGFTPAAQSGLLGWGRADAGLTIPSGNNVTAWADKSGNGSNMSLFSGATADPQFIASSLNGQPAVSMLAPSSAILVGTLGSTFSGTALTAIVVGTLTFTNSGRVISMYTNANNDTAATSFTLYQTSSTVITLFNAANKSAVTTADRTSGLAGVYSARFDGTNCFARATGTDGTTVAATPSLSVNLFAFNAPLGLETRFDVCEWAIIGHALSASEFAQWSGYTNARYGLAA